MGDDDFRLEAYSPIVDRTHTRCNILNTRIVFIFYLSISCIKDSGYLFPNK